MATRIPQEELEGIKKKSIRSCAHREHFLLALGPIVGVRLKITEERLEDKLLLPPFIFTTAWASRDGCGESKEDADGEGRGDIEFFFFDFFTLGFESTKSASSSSSNRFLFSVNLFVMPVDGLVDFLELLRSWMADRTVSAVVVEPDTEAGVAEAPTEAALGTL